MRRFSQLRAALGLEWEVDGDRLHPSRDGARFGGHCPLRDRCYDVLCGIDGARSGFSLRRADEVLEDITLLVTAGAGNLARYSLREVNRIPSSPRIPRSHPIIGVALVFVALLVSSPGLARNMPWALGKSNPEDLIVELVTVGPGDAIHELFGHTALLVRDRRRRVERLYNYGMFTFGRAMIPNFALGRLTFWVAEQHTRSTLMRYVAEGRDVRRIELLLEPHARQRLAAALARDVLPEHRSYLYDHYSDNCSTRIADAVDKATRGQLSASLRVPGRYTLREHTRRYTQRRPFATFMMMHVMGPSVDQPVTRYQELFLPEELERAVRAAHIQRREGSPTPLAGRLGLGGFPKNYFHHMSK